MKTYSFEDGKYEYDRDEEYGTLLAARRHGEPWPAGFESNRFSKSFGAILNRIDELEAQVAPVNAPSWAVMKQADTALKTTEPVTIEGQTFDTVRKALDSHFAVVFLRLPNGDVKVEDGDSFFAVTLTPDHVRRLINELKELIS